MPSDESLRELKGILKEDFNQDLNQEQLKETANNFIAYFDLLGKNYKNQKNAPKEKLELKDPAKKKSLIFP